MARCNDADPACLEQICGLFLHEAERPAAYGMLLCECRGCRVALEATGRRIDRTFVCVKYARSRRRAVHWRQYCEASDLVGAGKDPDAYLRWATEDDDWVREVFVVRGTGAPDCGCESSARCRLGLTRDTLP